MEISKLADKIITCLHEGGVYTDLTDSSMKDILCDYLSTEYNKKLNALSIKFDLRILSGESLTQADYDAEFAKLKENLIDTMNEIARIR